MRFLGVDLGGKRIGLALGESESGVASPLRTIDARADIAGDVSAILAVADEYAADAIVLGLPLNMDDTEGPQARLSREVAAALERAGSLPVRLYDERLTSHAADQRLAGRELTRKRKKARQDAVAAQVLLESFMAGLGADPPGATGQASRS
ncbi:MAG TPA: Holliday junction resolvase RuvX [Phycisphaerae bacterium]|nr:Holliday junction resolvase RuvX [Phycisphaerae bacterium]HRY67758.1 Holliday junction resolvase RuvX [Phycisphaerae bacterium]HSA25210.1 Holliday junction resolvase RuvX [Phycisphaerae bacterium]